MSRHGTFIPECNHHCNCGPQIERLKEEIEGLLHLIVKEQRDGVVKDDLSEWLRTREYRLAKEEAEEAEWVVERQRIDDLAEATVLKELGPDDGTEEYRDQRDGIVRRVGCVERNRLALSSVAMRFFEAFEEK